MQKPILKLEDVSKVYSGEVLALKSTDLTLSHGVFGLLGPNGAGKTTLLRLIATLLKPTSGKINLNGNDSVKDRFAYRSSLGYLPQNFGLHTNLTAYEQLLYFASLKGIKGKEAKREALRLLSEVGLSEEKNRCVGEFSGGMKQRVGIAAAMIGSPCLLVVDEPTAGLDPEERIRFRSLIEVAARTSIVILSTHIVQDVELGCSRVAVVNGGKILRDCAPHELIETARGKTWVVEVSLQDCDKLKSSRAVTLVKDLPKGGVEVRFVGDRIGIGEQQVEPQLEDAYVNLLNSNTWSDW